MRPGKCLISDFNDALRKDDCPEVRITLKSTMSDYRNGNIGNRCGNLYLFVRTLICHKLGMVIVQLIRKTVLLHGSPGLKRYSPLPTVRLKLHELGSMFHPIRILYRHLQKQVSFKR